MKDEVAIRRMIKCARSPEGHDYKEQNGEMTCQKCGITITKGHEGA